MKIFKFLSFFIIFALTSFSLSAANVTLTWFHNKQNVDEFNVYEQQANLAWVLVKTVPKTDLTATLLNVMPGVHKYYVVAKNSWGESAPSNIASTPDVATSPSGLVVTITITVSSP